MAGVTFNQIAQDAFGILRVYAPNETPSATDVQMARRFANDMLSEWSQRDLFIPVIARERFDLVSGQGGPTNPYTIGVGGDFNTGRPSNQDSIVSANLILTATTPEVRVPLGIYTDDAYNANKLPNMSNTQPTGLYYNPTYTGGLGSIHLWPVPNNSTNDIELFLQKGVAPFDDLTTAYYLPDGFARALKYNLADAMQDVMGKELSPSAKRIADSSLGTFKRANVKLTDLASDATFAVYSRGIYNIQTGQ
jgi:hypothetical protein